MRDAFQPERKFVRVLIQGGDGVTNLDYYLANFDMEGVPVPVARKGLRNTMEVFVPYLPYEVRSQKNVKSSAVPTDPVAPLPDDKGMCATEENRAALQKLDR